MKKTWRAIAATTALALACLGLTGCTDTSDCDDAAGTSPGAVAVAAHLTTGKGPGGKSGKSRSGSGKSKSRHHTTVHHYDSDDCEDDD